MPLRRYRRLFSRLILHLGRIIFWRGRFDALRFRRYDEPLAVFAAHFSMLRAMCRHTPVLRRFFSRR